MRRSLGLLASVGALFASLAVTALPSDAADHLDADQVKKDGRTDINDVYLYESPTDPSKAVLTVTVNPAAGVISGTTFSSAAWYQINVDTDGDALADRRFFVSFGAPNADGEQSVAIYGPKADGTSAYLGDGTTGETFSLSNGGKAQAGLYDDPFFFDLAAFRNGLAFCSGPGGTGTDFFEGLNVSAITLEVPKATLGSGMIGVWANTRVKATYEPIDRVGRPAINTVFVHDPARKDLFNSIDPHVDPLLFRGDVVDTLTSLGNTTERANALADVLLPDILTFDLDSSDGFLNGRKLADDVIDAELALISNGAVTTDCVANDSTFQATFPYLGTPN
jgi:hypothetical protein